MGGSGRTPAANPCAGSRTAADGLVRGALDGRRGDIGQRQSRQSRTLWLHTGDHPGLSDCGMNSATPFWCWGMRGRWMPVRWRPCGTCSGSATTTRRSRCTCWLWRVPPASRHVDQQSRRHRHRSVTCRLCRPDRRLSRTPGRSNRSADIDTLKPLRAGARGPATAQAHRRSPDGSASALQFPLSERGQSVRRWIRRGRARTRAGRATGVAAGAP